MALVGDHQTVLDWVSLLVGAALTALRGRHALLVENLLLRQQLAVALRALARPRGFARCPAACHPFLRRLFPPWFPRVWAPLP